MIIKLLLAHKQKVVYLSVIYSITLLFFCLKTVTVTKNFPSHSDKLIHAMAYFVFTIFWYYTFVFSLKISNKKSLLLAIVFSVSYGIVIELLQEFMTIHRKADVLDVLANSFGTILAVIPIQLIKCNR